MLRYASAAVIGMLVTPLLTVQKPGSSADRKTEGVRGKREVLVKLSRAYLGS